MWTHWCWRLFLGYGRLVFGLLLIVLWVILEAIMWSGRMTADFYPAEETKCAEALIECKMKRLHHYEYADFLHFLLTSVSQHFTRIVLHFKSSRDGKKKQKQSSDTFIFFGILVSDKQEESPQHPIFFAVNALINFPSWRFLIDWQSAALISWWVRVRHWLFYKYYQNTDILISHPQKTTECGRALSGPVISKRGPVCLRCPFRDNR